MCLHVYVVYEDTNLYNDMGMTYILQFQCPHNSKAYKSYRISLFEKVKRIKFPVRGRFRCRVYVRQ